MCLSKIGELICFFKSFNYTMPQINIITAVSRPENLHILKKNIKKELLPYFKVTWYCIYDVGKNLEIVQHKESWIISKYGGIPNDCAGGSQRNVALDLITDGWVHCLDDDNILYKNFGKILYKQINDNKKIESYVVSSRRYGIFDLIADEKNIKIGYVDISQFIATKKIIDDIRFQENVYSSDFYFIVNILFKIYINNKKKVKFIKEFLSHYNYLRK